MNGLPGIIGSPGARLLVSDLLVVGRNRAAVGFGLIFAGALLEGAGVLMLVPIISLILDSGGEASSGGLAGPVFAWLGLETLNERIGVVLAVFAVVLAVRFVVLLFRDDLLNRLQQEFVVDLRARTFRQLARLPWAEVVEIRQGPIGHALTRDVDRAGQGVGLLINGAISSVMLIVQIALALVLAPVVTLIVALLGLVLFRALAQLRDRAERLGQSLTDEDLKMFQTVGGFLSGLKPAKAHGLESQYVGAFERTARQVAEQGRAFAWDYSLARLILQTTSGGIAILAILLGLFVLGTQPENLIVTLIILARLYSPLQGLQNSLQGIRHAAPSYRAARAIAGPAGVSKAAPVAVSSAASSARPLEEAPGITLDAVSYVGGGGGGSSHEGADSATRLLLDNVSIEIPAGKVTTLIGVSGAGKSTLCDLVVGLLTPSSGEVRLNVPDLDGVRLDAALADRLRASVAYVGQEPFLFDDSLRNNLCWGCAPMSDSEIWQALKVVGADGLARGLEGGLDGRIQAEGMRFSGGERQRLRLARALLRRPALMVLDEATSALDHDAEARVLRALLAARDGATVLMVSHRPGNLRLADHVIMLEAGRLIEAGPVAALARDPASRIGALLAPGASQPPSQPASDGSGEK